MKEHPVDTVLRGLREVAPAPGLEGRVAAALRASPVAAPARGLGWLWMPAAAVAAIAVVAVVIGMHRHQPSDAHQVARVQAVARVAVPLTVVAAPPKAHMLPRRASAALEEKSVEEASFPPPPLPLTRQERLLVRLAHADDPNDLAALSPDARHAQQEQAKAEVRAFFAPPPMPLDPLPESTGGN